MNNTSRTGNSRKAWVKPSIVRADVKQVTANLNQNGCDKNCTNNPMS